MLAIASRYKLWNSIPHAISTKISFIQKFKELLYSNLELTKDESIFKLLFFFSITIAFPLKYL